MDYRDTYMDFEWKRIEGELEPVSREESPLDMLVRRENMRQLADSLIKLNRVELICVMMMNYDEIEKSVAEVQQYMKDWYGNYYSTYKIRRFQESGLRKVRSRLKNTFGWER